MEARIYRAATIVAAMLALGANYRTPNFIITAPTQEFATQVGQAAEQYRRDLAILWLGHELPRWAEPCPIFLQVGPHLGAGGATSFVFDRGEVFGWHMTIQGTPERLLDSVLPHEVTHTVFASHFRRPLPRWADEGACTTVEHESERRKQQQMLVQFLQSKPSRGIAFSDMFVMRDYPPDVLPLYSQGFSLCRFLIQQGGRKKFVGFVGEGMRSEQWAATTRQYYGFESLAALQAAWVDWVRSGSPLLDTPADEPDSNLLVSNDRQRRPDPDLIYRAQSGDQPVAPARPKASVASIRSSAPPQPNEPAPSAVAATPSTPASVAAADKWHAPSRALQPAVTIDAYPKDVPAAGATVAGQTAASPRPASATAATATPPRPPAQKREVLLEWSRQSAAIDTSDSVAAPPNDTTRQAAFLDAARPSGTILR